MRQGLETPATASQRLICCLRQASGRWWDLELCTGPKHSVHSPHEGEMMCRWWVGGRPATAKVMRAMLEAGASPVLCPGGVRECLFLRHDAEVVFLRQRLGFVRIALQYGKRCSVAEGMSHSAHAGCLWHGKGRSKLLVFASVAPGARAPHRMAMRHVAS